MPGWNELFKRQKYLWTEPHPSVVNLAQKLQDLGLTRVLDLGCGAGRHMAYLSKLGLQVVGIDSAVTGLVRTANWLRSLGLPCRIIRADMTAIPLHGGTFDCVISIYVLHHNMLAMIKRAVAEVRRLLVPRGILLATVLSKEDWKYKEGKLIERDTYVLEAGDEAGVLHHFFDRRGLRNILEGFSIRRIVPERIDEDVPGTGTVRHRHWEVWAESD